MKTSTVAKLILLFIVLLFVFMLTSCSSQKRCEWHSDRAKQLGCLKIDTITKYDTLKGFQVDTIFKADSFSTIDTFTLIKDNVVSKTVVNWKTKIINQSILKRDTIREFKTISKTEFKEKEVVPLSIKIALGVLTLLCLGLVFIRK